MEIPVEEYFEHFYRTEEKKHGRFVGQLEESFQTRLARAHANRTPAECHFYHTMDFGSGEIHHGAWDLRGGEREYLGFVDLAGQRVLELGPATGYLSFYMEAKGADVVCFDLALGMPPDIVPLPGIDVPASQKAGASFIRLVHNSWWMGHARYKSRNKAVYGDIYDLPRDLGRYDVATFGCILLHLSNPFAALRQAAEITEKAIIVTDLLQRSPVDLDGSCIEFNPGNQLDNPVNWWGLTPGAIVKMLSVLGFGVVDVFYHVQRHRPRHDVHAQLVDVNLFTVVGQRSAGVVPKHRDADETVFATAPQVGPPEVDPTIRVALLEAEIRALRASTSWRISLPIRIVGDLVKRIRA